MQKMPWTTKIDQPERRAQGWWRPRPSDWSRLDRGEIDPRLLAQIPGQSGEHRLFEARPSGRYEPRRWRSLVSSVRRRGVKFAVMVEKLADGRVSVREGNHRIRAAVAAGRDRIPVEIWYYGGSEESGLVYDPETGIFDPEGRA